MKHVSVLVPHGHFSLVNVEGTYQVFSWVNQILAESGKEPLFRVQLVGLASETTQTSGLFTIHTDVLLSHVSKTDLVVLPAIHGPLDEVLVQNEALLPWIVKQY